MPSVPDPKASFPGLFDAHRGDFQVTPVPVLPRHALLPPPSPFPGRWVSTRPRAPDLRMAAPRSQLGVGGGGSEGPGSLGAVNQRGDQQPRRAPAQPNRPPISAGSRVSLLRGRRRAGTSAVQRLGRL